MSKRKNKEIDKRGWFYEFSVIAGTKEFFIIMYPKCIILFLTSLFYVSGGFGVEYFWLNLLGGFVVVMYVVISTIKAYLRVRPKYFESE